MTSESNAASWDPRASGGAGSGSPGGSVAMLVIAWLWVGIPLVWGVAQTVYSSLPLFRGGH